MWNNGRSQILLLAERIIGTAIVRLFRYGAAAWITLTAAAGMRVAGSLSEHLNAALIIAVLMTVVLLVTDAVAHERVSIYFTVPAVLLVSVPLGDTLGVRFEVSAWWGYLLAAAAIIIVAIQVGRAPEIIRAWLHGNSAWRSAFLFGGFVLTFAGLWLSQAVLGGVEMTATGAEQLATLMVLAALFPLGGANIVYFDGFYGLWRIVLSLIPPMVVSGLKLWALCWLSTWLAATLRIDGFGMFALATIIVTVVTAPIWLYEQAARAQEMWEEEEYHRQQAMAEQQAILNLSIMSALGAARDMSRFAEEQRRRQWYR